MKGIVVGLAVAAAVASGCTRTAELIKAGSVSCRTDVFSEVTDAGVTPQGYADLRIFSSLKTHNPGVHSASSDRHGTPEYRLLMNIDGQSVELNGHLRAEDEGAPGHGEAEGGKGTRYHFHKKVRLKAGSHKVLIAIPADAVALERELTLEDGSSNNLVLGPVYRSVPARPRTGGQALTGFKEGIKGFDVVLNGKPL